MEQDSSSTDNGLALILVGLQAFAWFLAVIPLFGYLYASNAGFSERLASLFITNLSMLYIFISNFYLTMKGSLSKPYRYIAAINFIGLIVLLLIHNR